MRYRTITLADWGQEGVYTYDLFFNIEKIIEGKKVFDVINELNNEGYFISAIDSKSKYFTYYLTRQE